MRLRFLVGLVGALALQACTIAAPQPTSRPAAQPAVATPPALSGEVAARNFVSVVERGEPVAEAQCRAHLPRSNCDFRIVIDDRPDQGVNAFQTLDENGRPILGFTIGLIAEARNADELAFVMGHEAAHHIEGHIPQAQRQAQAGAIAGALLGALLGADATFD